jgi:hypothetical protein
MSDFGYKSLKSCSYSSDEVILKAIHSWHSDIYSIVVTTHNSMPVIRKCHQRIIKDIYGKAIVLQT